MSTQRAVVIGISGCSSSGKTTLARLLRDIFPSTFILHEDDFYKPENQLPVKQGLVDWDCPEAISIPDMERALLHVRATGEFPPDVDSKEDQNSVGACPVTAEQVATVKARVDDWLQRSPARHALLAPEGGLAPYRLCLLDGFLLYTPAMASVMRLIDIKLFLLVSRERATQRREARDGYVTLEGFWKDPPGYVDKIVWPNYATAHSWLFRDGNVEGELDTGVLAETGIRAPLGHGLDVEMGKILNWAVDTIMQDLDVRFAS
ncbi:hypothetical protein VTK73DRAFT_4803 [Phialemonium thermophilum]|uniref:Nicotinamide riboside kinase n=1 Tax=Phialemonium thermophilum TaxID=223376 RepID=A0ABR3XZQ1_9PEZI